MLHLYSQKLLPAKSAYLHSSRNYLLTVQYTVTKQVHTHEFIEVVFCLVCLSIFNLRIPSKVYENKDTGKLIESIDLPR